MKYALAFAVLATAMACPAIVRAAVHPCADEAREQARRLLVFHTETDLAVHFEDEVRVLAPLTNPAAPKQRFDVLETWGYLYKAKYRFRLLYAQVPGSCALMGQEILEHAKL
jgi:hypothetical protein